MSVIAAAAVHDAPQLLTFISPDCAEIGVYAGSTHTQAQPEIMIHAKVRRTTR